MSFVTHIIVAGGSGSRYGGELPKQFCEFCGRPLLMETIERFRAFRGDEPILLVINEQMGELWNEMCEQHGFSSPRVVHGGRTRWESVKNALSVVDDRCECIVVHDGARPLVTRMCLDEVVSAVLAGHDGAIPVVAVTDSLRELGDAGGSHAVDRSRFRAVQTPQAFGARKLKAAYALPYEATMTDDATVMEHCGFKDILLVEGDPHNIKITHPGDIALAEMWTRE